MQGINKGLQLLMIYKDKIYYKYLTVSEATKKWGLYITGAGYTEVCGEEEYPCKNHPEHHYFHYSNGRRLSEFQLLYISKGKGVFESEASGKKTIKMGDVFILFPGIWHRFAPNKKTGWNEYWVEFNGTYAHHLMKSGFLKPTEPVVKLDLKEEVIFNYLKLIKYVRYEEITFQFHAAGVLLQIIGHLAASKVSGTYNGQDVESLIKKAKTIIADNLNQPISPEKIAKEMGVSYSLFRIQFKKYTGFSPVQYHILLKVQKARELLNNTNYSIKEISQKLGFDSQYYFSRVFKQKTGQTPSGLRMNNYK